MANDTFVISSRQSAELDHAFERNGWDASDVKWLSQGDNLAAILDVRHGCAKIVPVASENYFRETAELSIQIPALVRPTLKQLQSKYSWIKSIERDSSPTDAVTLKPATVLRGNEKSINGGEYEKRIAGKLDIILGYQQAVWLIEHQDEFPEFMALFGKVYIDFAGLVVVNANGNRNYPYLNQNGKRWYLNWNWIDNDFNLNERVASSGNLQ